MGGLPTGRDAQEDIAEAVCEREWDGQKGANGRVGTGKTPTGDGSSKEDGRTVSLK